MHTKFPVSVSLRWWLGISGILLLSTTARSVAAEDAVIRAARSGAWSEPATWTGGKVPGAGAKVLIPSGHRVVYDVAAEHVIRAINIAGTLSFAKDRSTQLNVGLIKIQDADDYSEEGFDCELHAEEPDPSRPRAALDVGTPNEPIPAGQTARIRLVYQEGMNKDSCPSIVCCGGRMDFHGAPIPRTWVKLGQAAKAGDGRVTLSDTVLGWKAGDRIILTATDQHGPAQTRSKTEECVIKQVDGKELTLEEPLQFGHLGDGDFRAEAANLSRNVIVESGDPEGVRGHTMYHRHSAGSLSYAEFRSLGKKGVLGRYSLHFHLIGDTMRGSSVIGNSIWDSGNRWLTIHGTNHLVVRDNVGYKSVGHGFFLEDGTEVHNVLDHNLAVGARRGQRLPKQVLPFDHNEGAGYWWANSLNTFTRNIAADCDLYGMRYEATPTSALKLDFDIQQPDGTMKLTDIRTLPFVRFEDNEVHSSLNHYGVNLGEGVNFVGPDSKHPFVVRNLKIWDVHYGFRPQVPSLLVENLMIHKAHYGIYHPNYDNHLYRHVTISQTSTEPFNRGHDDLSVQHGVLAVDGITFDGIRSGGMPLIQISDDNETGRAVSHFRGLRLVNWNDNSKEKAVVNLGGGPRPTPKSAHGVPIFLHDWFGPGKHAEVVSVKSPEYKAAPEKYKTETALTGDESRVAAVDAVEFPTPVQPVDDLPPSTVITHLVRRGDKVYLQGTSADNGQIVKVTVNGQAANSLRADFAEWDLTLTVAAGASLKVVATDAAGNVEPRGHTVSAP